LLFQYNPPPSPPGSTHRICLRFRSLSPSPFRSLSAQNTPHSMTTSWCRPGGGGGPIAQNGRRSSAAAQQVGEIFNGHPSSPPASTARIIGQRAQPERRRRGLHDRPGLPWRFRQAERKRHQTPACIMSARGCGMSRDTINDTRWPFCVSLLSHPRSLC
jgi:hypothetical protein